MASRHCASARRRDYLVAISAEQEISMPNEVLATGRFDIGAIAGSFPESAATLLVDEYLTSREQASARVFRVYRPTPPHYHATCDEYLYVFSGRGTFFERNTIHAMPKLFDYPVVFLSIDTPRRDPMDIIFVDPNEATPQTFMARNRTTK
jgi:hypothetical protein